MELHVNELIVCCFETALVSLSFAPTMRVPQ